MALKMCSVVIQMAIPSYSLHTKSSKLCGGSVFTTTTGGAAARLPPLLCSSQPNADHVVVERRSGNYSPSLWDVDYILSLDSEYKEEEHRRRAGELIMEVKMVLERETDPIQQLELIDDLQRLALSDHFQDEFKQILNNVYLDRKYYKINNGEMMREEIRDLYSTALAFRLLRQHGFQVAQEVFECFKNDEGEFEASLSNDTRGLLQLYEASFLLTEGENTLELAREFAANLLQEKLNEIDDDDYDDNLVSSMINYALDIPIHWRIKRPNASACIDAYRKREKMNPVVLELAILDSNVVQAQYQEELKEASRWWSSTCLVQQLPFVRDRIVECYFWTTGVLERREHGYERIMITKIFALVTVIDDVFDVYGTLEELELFTSAIQRWDIESMKQLPPYMQLCYFALHSFVNETAYDTLQEKGFNPIPYLHKTWVDLIEAYMTEAKWYYSGYKPSMQEYLDNAWVSIGALPILSDLFFRLTNSIEEETVESMHKYHHAVRASCMITRLADDMGTILDEEKRGDVPKSIQCYMNEKKGSEEEAREHVRTLISETWKTMNKEMMMSADSPFSKYFLEALANMARTAQCVYQNESDGFGMQHSKVNKLLRALLFNRYA